MPSLLRSDLDDHVEFHATEEINEGASSRPDKFIQAKIIVFMQSHVIPTTYDLSSRCSEYISLASSKRTSLMLFDLYLRLPTSLSLS